MLLFAATACDSGSDDSAATTAPAAAETTVGDTPAPSTEPAGTDAPTEPTAPPADATNPPASSAAPTPTEPPVVVPEALQFTAALVGGGTFDGAAAAGKPTLFWHWGPT